MILNGLKDFFEDLKRKQSDDQENSKKCFVFDRNKKYFEEKTWEDIKVGDIVRVLEDDEFPADLVLLHSSNLDGNCFIETKNLDGETNLKIKQSEGKISDFTRDEISLGFLSGVLHTKLPNENIFDFEAEMKIYTKIYSSDTEKNMNHIYNRSISKI